jgi:hypothetical protein
VQKGCYKIAIFEILATRFWQSTSVEKMVKKGIILSGYEVQKS